MKVTHSPRQSERYSTRYKEKWESTEIETEEKKAKNKKRIRQKEVKSIGSGSLKGRIDRMIDAPFLIHFILPRAYLFLSARAVPHRFLLFLPPLHLF